MLVYQPVYQPDALEDPGELEDPPSLGCFGQKLTCLQPVWLTFQVLADGLVDSPFGGV